MHKRIKHPLVELKMLRSNYGNDGQAINRHSVRYYRHGDDIYMLDRILDVSPTGFTLYRLADNINPCEARILPTVEVDGCPDWGNNLSWNKAELKVMNHLGAAGVSRDTTDDDSFVARKLYASV